MIQRIQSIFLVIGFALAGLSFVVPAWVSELGPGKFIVNNLSVKYEAAVPLVSGTTVEVANNTISTWYCAMMASSVAILALFALVKFSNRVFQNQLCHFGSFLSLLWSAAYFIAIYKAQEDMLAPVDGSYGLAFYFPFLSVVVFQAAAYFIRKDEELVRSADRIR